MKNKILNTLGWIAAGGLVTAQRDEIGVPLMDGYHGLGIVVIICLFGALANAISTDRSW